jgi:NTE family protein
MRVAEDKRIALVLGAGGARGLAHVGVIEELQARGYQIEAVVGCSIGALVGGVYCAGRLSEYKQWSNSLSRRNVFRLVDFAFGHPGFIKGDRVIAALRELVGLHLIENLPIAYKAVATNLDTRESVWISEGKLFDAIRASIAIPMLLTPYWHQGHDLVDGGLLAPLPVAGVKEFSELRIIAVDINAVSTTHLIQQPPTIGSTEIPVVKARRNVIELMSRSLSTMHGYMAQVQLAEIPPDLLISIPDDACSIYEFWRSQEMIELGRQAACLALDEFEAGN